MNDMASPINSFLATASPPENLTAALVGLVASVVLENVLTDETDSVLVLMLLADETALKLATAVPRRS